MEREPRYCSAKIWFLNQMFVPAPPRRAHAPAWARYYYYPSEVDP